MLSIRQWEGPGQITQHIVLTATREVLFLIFLSFIYIIKEGKKESRTRETLNLLMCADHHVGGWLGKWNHTIP